MQLVAVGLIRRAPKRSRRGLGDVAHLDFRTVALDPNCGSRLLSEDCDTKIVRSSRSPKETSCKSGYFMRVVIQFAASSRKYIQYLELGRPDDEPSDVPFLFPNDTLQGDRVLSYVGGTVNAFVGYGKVHAGWRMAGRGPWKGMEYVRIDVTSLHEPVPGDDVHQSTGFRRPTHPQRVPNDLAAAVWRAARGRPLSTVERAVEGAATESRSRHRDPGLRQDAIAQAGGVCASCGRDFSSVAGGLGRRCLVVHHKRQLRDTDQPVETKLTDLAVVCANCHMMIHADSSKALTVAALRRRLSKTSPA